MKKIQIREVHDRYDNIYPIFDLMQYDKRLGLWRSLTTYFTLQDALRWHSDVEIEDIREVKE